MSDLLTRDLPTRAAPPSSEQRGRGVFCMLTEIRMELTHLAPRDVHRHLSKLVYPSPSVELATPEVSIEYDSWAKT